ncbi:MAG: imidazole glycerol phosphate synthase subunit HisH, partial [Solirubrobacteraceae bacterium]
MTTIGIVDHGMGNRRSVEKALERVGARVALTADHDALRAADGLVVPGVGAFAAAMRAMRELGLDELVVERAGAGTPVLGLCLGMQLLFDSSTELGGDRGLGLLPGRVVALEPGALKIPHIGW